MTIEELETLKENRTDEETLNQTHQRLISENRFPLAIPENKESQEAPESPDFDGNLTIPRYKLIQPSCRIEGATIGCFRNSLTEEEFEKLENIVFLVQQNSRTLFPEDDFSGLKKCWSFTGYSPAKEQIFKKTGEEPMAPVCASRDGKGNLTVHCPYAEWRNQLGEPDPNGSKPPLCKASISFLGLDSSKMPFWIIFHGTAIPIIKDFLRFVAYKKVQGKHQGKDVQLYSFRITLGLKLQTNAKGRYYVPVFEKKEEITDEGEAAILKNCYASLRDCFLSEPMEAENEK